MVISMEYKRFENMVFARIDKGEEIVETLKAICEKEDITLAYVNAIGAVGDVTVGVFKTAEKQYYSNSFKGDFEIVSLSGTVTQMNKEHYSHLHMSVGNEKGEVFGGHLNKAVVSATCEMVINIVNGKVSRRFSDEIGLNLFDFD